MDEDRTSSALSLGSEARPNTPFTDPFSELHKDNTEYATTTKDPAVQLWVPEDNTGLGNHSHPLKPQISHKHSLNRQKTLPYLPPVTEEPGLSSNERTSENEIEECKSGGKKIDTKSKSFKKFKNSLRKTNENDQNLLTIANCSIKSVVALPKIDTYCISYIRPSTNHGFSYAVSSSELLKDKNTTVASGKMKRKASKLNSTSENGFPHPGPDMYLLFRAPSRACGLNIPGLTVRAKPKEVQQHLKGAKQVKKAKTTVQTNIVRLPDINEDTWK